MKRVLEKWIRYWKPVSILLVFVVSLCVMVPERRKVEFFGDESHWIHTSKYLEEIFTLPETNFSWEENYWTLTQPPVTRYIIGISRKLQHYNVADLNGPWIFSYGYDYNIRNHNLPSKGLLYASRLPMAIISALICTITFYILLDIGLFPAVLWFILYISSDYIKTHTLRAMGESPLLLFSILTCLAAIFAYKAFKSALDKANYKQLNKYYLWLIVSGIFCGLAGATKINGLIMFPMIPAAPLLDLLIYRKTIEKRIKLQIIISSIFIVVFSSIFCFIAVNPYLYDDSFQKIANMYKNRVYEMATATVNNPNDHITSLEMRIELLFHGNFSEFLPFQFPGKVFVSPLKKGVLC